MIIFIAWVLFCILVGAFAKNIGRSFGGWMFLSMLISPLFGGLILLISYLLRKNETND